MRAARGDHAVPSLDAPSWYDATGLLGRGRACDGLELLRQHGDALQALRDPVLQQPPAGGGGRALANRSRQAPHLPGALCNSCHCLNDGALKPCNPAELGDTVFEESVSNPALASRLCGVLNPQPLTAEAPAAVVADDHFQDVARLHAQHCVRPLRIVLSEDCSQLRNVVRGHPPSCAAGTAAVCPTTRIAAQDLQVIAMLHAPEGRLPVPASCSLGEATAASGGLCCTEVD
mmetsp:Transcript_79529/g.219979  ORF Transcript_79529/g.219979 Transcript_79529/m.219979 type:complete len:232 (-) Transcript_79529:425-1120(-)